MIQTVPQSIITIALCALATILTRFIPFILFRSKEKTPKVVEYLGKALPAALFAMLVVYCLRNTEISTGNHGIPELIGILVVTAAYFWKKNMLVSMAAGTIVYMLLVQFVF